MAGTSARRVARNTHLVLGGYWSSYWYGGRVYGTEIARGLDVLSLTPSDALPSVSMTDKVQHALGFFCLTLAYGLMFPRARTAVTAGVVCLGVAVEVLQAIMPFGRSAELGDLIADAVGIVAGLVLVRLLAGPARLPT